MLNARQRMEEWAAVANDDHARQTPNSPSHPIFSSIYFFRIVTFYIEISGFHCQPYYYFILKNSISLSSLSSSSYADNFILFFFFFVRFVSCFLFCTFRDSAIFSFLTYQINGSLCIRYNLIASIGYDLLTFVRVGSIADPFRMQFDISQRQKKNLRTANQQNLLYANGGW